MGLLIKADFKKKLDIELYRFDPKNPKPEYHAKIFCDMFSRFPQFKAHVAAYIERNYCIVVNDEDHAQPQSILHTLKPDEVRMLNQWIVNRNNKASVLKQS